MENKEQLMLQLLEKAQQDKRAIRLLKNTAVRCQLFELAANVRDIEVKNFPPPEGYAEVQQRGKALNLLFRMVELNVSPKTAWLIEETLKVFKKKKGKFDLKDAAELTTKLEMFFDNDEKAE